MYIYIYMSYQQKYRKTEVVEIGPGISHFCKKPSQPIGGHPLTDTLFSHIYTPTTARGPPTLAMSIAGSTCYCPSVIYFGMCSHRWYVCRYIYIYISTYISFYIYIYLSTYTHAFDVDDIWYDMSGQVLTTSLSSHALEAWKTKEVIPKCPNYSAVELSCTQKIDKYIDRSIDREMDTYIYIYIVSTLPTTHRSLYLKWGCWPGRCDCRLWIW